MTRSRKLQFQIVNLMRVPIVKVFNIAPKFIARYLLGLFRWSGSFVGYGIRYLCVKKLAKSCGAKVLVFPGCQFHWLENCEIGENVSIHDFCYIDAIGGIKIGNDTRIAHNSSIITGQHIYDVPGKTIYDSGYTKSPVSIGSDVWLGTGVVVLQGITIGDGCVVGANSVVTEDVESSCIVGGVPAKLIKHRFDTKVD